MKIFSTAVCAVAALVAIPALAAEGPAWTYGQLGYTQISSFDNSDSFNLDGSLGIADLFHVQAQYRNGQFGDFGEGDDNTDFDTWTITAGVHPHVGASTDAVFDVRYTNIDIHDTNNDADAWGLGAGLRHMMTDKLELNAMINWDRISPDNSNEHLNNSSWTVGGRYMMTPALSAGVSYTDSDSTGFLGFGGGAATVDVRYQFGDIL